MEKLLNALLVLFKRRKYTWISENLTGADITTGHVINYGDFHDITFVNLGADTVIVDNFPLVQNASFTDPAAAFDGCSIKTYNIQPANPAATDINLIVRRKVYVGADGQLPKSM